MLGLATVLPRQINDEIALILVLAHVNRRDGLVPAAAGGFPVDSLGTGWRRRVAWVVAILLRALSTSGRRGGVALSTPLSTLHRVVRVFIQL